MNPDSSPDSAPAKLTEALRLLGLAAALGAATWLLLHFLVPSRVPDDYPALPALQSASPAVRDVLTAADAEARKHPASPDSMGALGLAYHANEFLSQAAAAYRIATRLAPRDPQWLYAQALLAEENGNSAAQLDFLRQTVAIVPDDVPSLLKLGDAAFKQEALDEAAGYFERAAKSSSKEALVAARFGLARIAARRKDWAKVLEIARPLAQQYPTVRPPIQLLEQAYAATNQTAEAARIRNGLQVAKTTDVPPPPDPVLDRLTAVSCSSTRLLKAAGLRSRFGHPSDGVAIARRAAQATPTDADIRNYIARTQLSFFGANPAAVDEALTQMAEVLRLRPSDPTPLWGFTNDFFEDPKSPAALDRLQSLLQPYSNRPEAHFYLGLLADARGQVSEALSQFQSALAVDPKNSLAQAKIGLIWLRSGKLDPAITAFHKALALDPLNTVARFNLGIALMQTERYEQGITEFRNLLLLRPADPSIHFSLGFGYLFTHRLDQAVSSFREGLRYKTGDPEAHYGLASALAAQKNRDEALAEIKEALRLRPDYPEAQALFRQLAP